MIVSGGRVMVEGTLAGLKAELRGDAVQVELANGQVLRARVENGGRAVPGIMQALEAREIAVASVTLSRPSLDDVYLHYTGRDFKADDTLEEAA